MWRNYLIVAIRALAANRTYAFVTLSGLAIGMAACLMILLFVRYELSYDRWLPNHENIYQVQSWHASKETGEPSDMQTAPYVAGGALQKDFPQIEKHVFAMSAMPVLIRDGRPWLLDDFAFVDSNFFDVVDLPLVHGSRSALDRIGSAVITQSEARKHFGTDRVVGRTLTIITKGITYHFRIGAVLQDIPRNSHMHFTVIARADIPAMMAEEAQFLTCWTCQGGWLYVQLKPGTNPRTIETALPAWERRHIPDEKSKGALFGAGDEQDWHLVNVGDVHLGKAQVGAMTPGNDGRTIMTFAAIALLILAMAVVNFINLATARASQRAREVALRKVLGASRIDLVAQFVGEALLLACVAMLLALSMVELLMPAYASFLKADFALRYFGHDGIAPYVVALTLAVGILGGLYPAFYLARFQPASVLKANKSAAEAPGTGRLRNALVVGQFAVSIVLIICTAVVYAQTAYARTLDPGFRRAGIMQVDGLNRAQLMNRGDEIVERIARVPGVLAVGRSGIGIGTPNDSNTGVLLPTRSKPILMGSYFVDEGLLKAMGMTMVAGRWFDRRRSADTMTLPFPLEPESQKALVARGGNVVINQRAAERLGFTSAAEAVGKSMKAALVEERYGLVPVTIVGVVRDARFGSAHMPIEPILFENAAMGQNLLVIRYSGDPSVVRGRVRRAWKGISRDVPFEARFSEDIVQDLYKTEDARARTLAAFSALAVIVACLGLFGLAAFTAERRTKEIGIRKVLGARTQDVVRMLAWQFSKPVIIANLIAWPMAWWAMRDWLDGFDARITLGPLPFIAAGAVALAIAIGTIAGHAVRVARANPIHALRYE